MPGDRDLAINQVYPEQAFYHNGNGGRVLDVTKPPFNAKGDGVTDDTQALCAAMRFVAESYEPLVGDGWSYCGCKLNKSWIIYLPDGEYLVSDTVDQGWPARVWHPFDGWSNIRRTTLASPEDAERRKGERWHAENFLIRIVGQSRAKTVIRLRDDCPGFGPGRSRAVVAFHQSIFSNVSQGNYFENITITTGKGNPGAVALKWSAANWGGVRNSLLRSSDGQGRAGLMMDVGCVEGYLRDITVDGFETGIDIGADGATVAVLEHATVKNQSVLGIRVGRHHDCLDARKLRFENVPTAVKADNGSHVVLLESRAGGREGAAAALSLAEHGHLFVRDFECAGFAAAVADPGKAPLVAARIDEFVSDPPVTPRPDVPAESLRLPVRDMPVILPEPDLTKWADVQAFGAKGDGITDDTVAIQRAMDCGKPVVYFPRVAYVVNGTVNIPASIREVCFLHGNVYRSAENPAAAMFRVSEPSSEPLLLRQNVNAGGIFIDHEADRPLVLEDVHTWFHHVRGYARAADMLFPGVAAQTADIWQLYRNTRPDGPAKEVFAANVMGFAVGGKDARHAVENVRAWVRQLNNEHIPYAQVALRLSDLWLLGFKVENAELLFHADQGTRLEVLGGIYHNFSKWGRGAMVHSSDSQITALFVLWSGGAHQPNVLQTVAGKEATRIPIWQFPLIDSKTSPAPDTRAGTFVISLFNGDPAAAAPLNDVRHLVRTETWTEHWPDAAGKAEAREVTADVWTAALQAALDARGSLHIPARGEPYYLDGPLVLKSGQQLVADPEAEIRLKPGCNTCMVRNANILGFPDRPVPADTRPDTDIHIEGGIWSTGAGNTHGFSSKQNRVFGTHGVILLHNVRKVSVKNVTVKQSKPFAIHFGNAHEFLVDGLTLEDTWRDGVHVNGPASRGVIRNVRGTSRDDPVALNAWEWKNYAPSYGPIRDVLVEDVTGNAKGASAIRLLPGVKRFDDGTELECPLENITLRRITDIREFKAYAQPNLELGRDKDFSIGVGSMKNIRFEDLVFNHPGKIELHANTDGLVIRDVRINHAIADGWHLLAIGPPSATYKHGSADPAKWVEIFSPDLDCTVQNVTVTGVRTHDSQAELPIERVVRVVEQHLNPDYPNTTPKGGTGKGIWLR